MPTRKQLLLFIVTAAIFTFYMFVRFYHITTRIDFGWDQERDAFDIADMVLRHKFTLIGPRVADDTGFFLGPYYTYILAPFYLLTKLHPSGSIMLLITYNIVFFLSSFLIVKKLFDTRIALGFLFLWGAVSTLIVDDTTPWNPLFIPLGIMVCWLLLKRIYEKNRAVDWAILGGVCSVFLNFHVQFIFLLLFSILFLLHVRQKVRVLPKNSLLFIGMFLLPFLPLVLFDLRHNFLNFNLLLDFLTHRAAPTLALSRLIVAGNFVKPLVYVNHWLAAVGVYLILVIGSYKLSKREKGFAQHFFHTVCMLSLTVPFLFLFYKRSLSEYYLTFLLPFIFIVFLKIASLLGKLWGIVILCIIVFVVNYAQYPIIMSTNYYGLYYKDLLVKELMKHTQKYPKYNISYTVTPGREAGFHYLIEYYGLKQTGNWKDALFTVQIPPKDDGVKVGPKMEIRLPY